MGTQIKQKCRDKKFITSTGKPKKDFCSAKLGFEGLGSWPNSPVLKSELSAGRVVHISRLNEVYDVSNLSCGNVTASELIVAIVRLSD